MHLVNDDLNVALRLADVADAAILPHFRALPGVIDKGAGGLFDPVTVADREAEAAMRALLASERPADAVVGEEFAATGGSSGRTWVLDPIDGTRGFMSGLPTWGVLIALCDPAGPVLGVMSQPFVGERFAATAQAAVHVRDGAETRLRTRPCPQIGEGTLATTYPGGFGAREPAFRRLSAACRMTRFGTDCYGYAMLAAGHIDVVVETNLKAVDIAPFVPIVEQAGGALVGWDGRPVSPTLPHGFRGDAIAVGDPALLPAVLDALGISS